jgi:hypothetical protein
MKGEEKAFKKLNHSFHPSSFIPALRLRAFPSSFEGVTVALVLRSVVAVYSCAGSGGFAPPSLNRRPLVVKVTGALHAPA